MSNRDPTPYKLAQYGSAVPTNAQQYHGYSHHSAVLDSQPGTQLAPLTYRYVQQKVDHEPSPPQEEPVQGVKDSHFATQLSPSGPFYGVKENVHLLVSEQRALRQDVESLKRSRDEILGEIETLKKGGWKVEVGPHMASSSSSFHHKLGELKSEYKGDADPRSFPKATDTTNEDSDTTTIIALSPSESTATTTPKVSSSALVPPHLRKAGQTPQDPSPAPLHRRIANANRSVTNPEFMEIDTNLHSSAGTPINSNKANSALITDGKVDDNLAHG
jgi:hypothetical protein